VARTVRKTLLALGAHYDDCVFGVPGIMVKAARRGYRVVILTLIGDYSNFPPAQGRSAELREGCTEISRAHGAEMRFLDWKGDNVQRTPERLAEVARAVAEVRPDVALLLWPHDRHGDHVAASPICESALRHAGPLLGDQTVRAPQRMYYYDNGPRHTIGFEPDTYVDVSDEWPAAAEWLERFMALAYSSGSPSSSPAAVVPGAGRSAAGGRDVSPNAPAAAQSARHPAVELKETLAAYRGRASGVRYAEALRSLNAYPHEIL
jgi:LmbE family N-acetylglucosaminyl deacetylase